MLFSNYAPLGKHSAPESERNQQKKTKKRHIFAPTAGARCTIFSELCMVKKV